MDFRKDLKVIIFDFDGTLHDLKVDWPQAREAVGAQPDEKLDAAITRLKQEDPDRLKTLHNIEDAALVDDQLDHSVSQTLTELSKHYKIAVLSRNSAAAIRRFLQRHDIQPDYLVGREDVDNLKPHPEGLERVLKHFAVTSAEVLMVGDSYHDVDVAKKAGITSVIVKNPRLDYPPKNADHYIDNISALSPLLRTI